MNKSEIPAQPILHLNDPDWIFTPEGEPRGYIQPHTLDELWFHTGTICNLRCPFCFEGSHPGNNRLQPITLDDARPVIEEAAALGVQQFSFTGGEPFVIRDMVEILDFALNRKPCLVLTNATEPLLNRLDQVAPLADKPFALRFRVSLDYPDPEKHDAGRGHGNFELSLKVMAELHRLGFKISIARQSAENENVEAVNAKFQRWFEKAGLPTDTHIVSFNDLDLPGSHPDVPYITEHCMTAYKTQEGREKFMCSYSKMVVKKEGRMRVYACTLVDDDETYDLGGTLTEAMRIRVMLRHHRCFGCFAAGTSCSES